MIVKRPVGVIVVLAAALSVLVASPAIAGIAPWSAPADLSLTGGGANMAQVTVDSTGRATAVWTRFDTSNWIIQSSTSLNGAAWSTPVDLSTAGGDAFYPQVTVDPTGRATAVWIRSNGSNDIIQSSTSLNGATWSTPVDLSATGRNADSPQVTVDPTGRATAVWQRYNASFEFIIQSSTSLNGATWSTPVDLTAAGKNANSPQVTVDPTGRALAVWRRFNASFDYVIQSSTSLNGAAWSTPVDLTAAGKNADAPQVTVDPTGRAIAVWLRRNGSGENIAQSSTSLSGAAWSTPVDLSATGADANSPQVMVGSTGSATAVWLRANGVNNIVQSSTSLNGAAWSTPVDLTAAGGDANGPQVTVDYAGRATAVWRLNGTISIIQSSASVTGATWSTPVDLSAPGWSASDPQVTLDSNGSVTAVWNRTNGTNTIIQSNTAKADPVVKPVPTLAATGTDANTLGLVAGAGALLVLAGLLVVIGSRRRTRPAGWRR
jgi:LPXTG-motif cell wall-anchored protein